MIKATHWCIKIKAKNLSLEKQHKIKKYVKRHIEFKFMYFDETVRVYCIDNYTMASVIENNILDFIEGEV